MDFLGYDRAVSRGNMYSQNVMDMKDMRQSQLRDEIGNISGNLADAETNIDKTRAEERIGTGVQTGVDILKTVHDSYSLKNVLSDHVKKGQEFAQKVSKQVGNQVAEQASPEPVQATPQPAEQPQSTPQSTPPEEPQPTGTQSGAQGTVEGSESAGQGVGESTATPVSSEVGDDSEKSGSRLARYAGISEDTARVTATDQLSEARSVHPSRVQGGYFRL
jgi:ribosomal protein S16